MSSQPTWADLLTPEQAADAPSRLAAAGPVTEPARSYGRAAVEKAAARLAATPEGARDDTLVGDACSTAGRCLAPGGCLDDTDLGWAVDVIEQAGRTAGLTGREVAKVASKVRSFAATSTNPIRPPDDDPPGQRPALRTALPTTNVAHLPATVAGLLNVLRRYQHLPDPGHVLVTLAVAVTRDLDDEPAWLLLVAPPSSGKTETVRVLDQSADARLNEVTAAGLLTWGKGKPPKPVGVLADLPERALLTFGDLSSLLATSDRGGRDAVFGLLRRVYDGDASRDIAPPPGAPAGSRLTWAGRATVVAAVTGIIDSYTAHADALGPRWTYYRLDDRTTAEKRSAAAMARRGGLADARAEAAALAAQIVATARPAAADVTVPDVIADHVEDAALVCCWGRASVPRHGYGRREIDGQATVEEPPRLIRQLAVLARGLLALDVDEETTTALVRRVALDSMPAPRRAALEVLAAGELLTTAALAARAGLERGVARRNLEELEVIGVVNATRAGPEPDEHDSDRRACTWTLAGEDGQLIAAVLHRARANRRRCAEMWGPTPPTPPERGGSSPSGVTPPHVSAHLQDVP